MKACGLISIPDRRTFDRRLSTISVDIKERISTMGNLFVNERLFDPYIVATSKINQTHARELINNNNKTNLKIA
jgi:hypothetical protein